MSASKKKKFKKLRIESTDSVLNKKKFNKNEKLKDDKPIDEVINNYSGESFENTMEIPIVKVSDSFDNTAEIPVVETPETIKNLIDYSEKINGDDKEETKVLEKNVEETRDETQKIEVPSIENQVEKSVEQPENSENSENSFDETKVFSVNKVLEEEKAYTGKEMVKVEKEEADEEKPEYVKEMLEKSRRRMGIFISAVGVFLVVVIFSTIFAILDSGSTVIAKGVKIKNIDVSKLTKEEAKTTIEDAVTKELIPEIKIKYEDKYETTFNAEQIEFEYDIDKAVDEAYQIGKSGNIVENNYSILLATLLGKNLELEDSYNKSLLDTFVDEVQANIPGVVIEPAYCREEDKLIVTKGIDGLTIDKDLVEKEIISSITERNALEMKEDGFTQTINLQVFETKAQDIDMAKIYEEIHTEPKDAYYELEPYALYPDVDGVDLAISVEEAQKQVDSETKDEYSFNLNITKADKTISDLGLEAFPYLISEFTTKYDASNVNRSTNLRIAAEKINGTVLMPGEEFSYNKVVGKRTVEEGYKDAKIYADGGVVDGLAGGICQISSTLYNAVLLANLEVTERYNHTYTTSYLPGGRDATVVWGSKDFKFVNSRTYPIKIEASVKNGIAEFKFHGIAEETEYEIKIIPVVTSSIPFPTVYEDDPALPFGTERVKQGGHQGCRVTTYKEVRLNGNTISKDVITTDTYNPMKKIIIRGVGGIPEM